MAAQEDDLVVMVEGLPPGTTVTARFHYVPDDGSSGRNVGLDQKVRGNEQVKFQTDYAEVVGDKHRPGQLRVEIAAPITEQPA